MGQIIHLASFRSKNQPTPQSKPSPAADASRHDQDAPGAETSVSCAKQYLMQAANALSDGSPQFERLAWMIQDMCWLLEVREAANNDNPRESI